MKNATTSLRSIALISVCVLSLSTLQAQGPFSIGFKTGLNLSTMSVDDAGRDYGFKPGFQVGTVLRYKVDKLGVQTEFLFSRQQTSVAVGAENLSIVSQYINIPLLLKYEFARSLNATLGPQIGMLTCMKSDYHPVTREKFEEQNYTKAYKQTDLGLSIGGGWESLAGYFVDLRYYHGLTDISNFEGVAETKNRMIQLSVGCRIKF